MKKVSVFKIVSCPFCDEEDFDLIGLKEHFEKGYCDIYGVVDDLAHQQIEEYKIEREKVCPT